VIFGADPWAADVDEALLRAYHCTRLTETDEASVRRNPLTALSGDLMGRRILQALEEGHLDVDWPSG
jgi:hypothetical protein